MTEAHPDDDFEPEYTECELCGLEFEDDELYDGLCDECREAEDLK